MSLTFSFYFSKINYFYAGMYFLKIYNEIEILHIYISYIKANSI